MATRLKPVPITPQQYLEIQRTTDVRSEYLAGEMVALAAPSRAHGIILMNIAGALTGPLRNTNCIGNVGTVVAAPASFLIPDLVVFCGGGDFTEHNEVLRNPTVIFEILSPSTSDYDHGHKWILYQQIPSLIHYVLVFQDEARVEVFSRESDGGWHYEVATDLDSSINLTAVNCQIGLASIYDRLAFE